MKKYVFIAIILIVIITGALLMSVTKKKETVIPAPEANCIKSGCSGQLCIDKNSKQSGITTCEWKNVYQCYKTAICEKQNNGKCGFTQSPEFSKCLSENR